MKKLKAVEMLQEIAIRLDPFDNKIELALLDGVFAELQELTQEKSCKQCALICIDGKDCDLASKTKQATGMKYAEMCFSCYTPKG
jgi:hypothetical protein